MAYPSTIASLTNPAASDKLNSPSHSTIETNQNTEITALETFVGTTSSAVGTLMYDVRATASNGGGHVQTANKGGTGQTSFAKGDLLVASSASVLSKLTVGTNAYVLTADSNESTGVKWASGSNAVPAWVDEGSVSWTAESTNKTLTFTNAGKDLYNLILKLNQTTRLDMQMNSVAGTGYSYTSLGSTAIAQSSGQAAFVVSIPNTIIVGQMLLTGKHNAGVKMVQADIATDGNGEKIIYGALTGDSNNLATVTFNVYSSVVTGTIHAYSLNLS